MSGAPIAFHTGLEAIEGLSAEERATLIEIVRRRLLAERRQNLLDEIQEAREEYKQRNLKPQSVDELFS